MEKVVEVMVLGGVTKSVVARDTETIEEVLDKVNIVYSGYDIFNENGNTLTLEGVLGDTCLITLSRQVKGNWEILEIWFEKRNVELFNDYTEKQEQILEQDTLQVLYTKATEELKNYIKKNEIAINIPKFTSIEPTTTKKLNELEKEYTKNKQTLSTQYQELKTTIYEICDTTEKLEKVLITKGIIDKEYNIL